MDYSARAPIGGRHFSGLSTMVFTNENIDNLTHHVEDGAKYPHEEHFERSSCKSFERHDCSIRHGRHGSVH